MIRNIIRYVGLALVIVGIVLVMKNVITMDDNAIKDKKSDKEYYIVNVELLDKDSNEYVSDATLVLKKNDGEVVEEWITKNETHIISKVKKGTYLLEQKSESEGYLKNEEPITFEVNNNKNIVMYNTLVKEDEVKNTSTDVMVDNTLSMKSGLSIILSFISIIFGSLLIIRTKGIKEI